MKRLHLICNAHIDPVWLWNMEEGISAVLSTFRTAADFCESNPGFVFNHNEALLYEWVEEMEPELFTRIQRLVKEGKWHIMGGWYLQPDCNMPSGESFLRQISAGRKYFMEKFGVKPTTAINFDPFGHTRGLAQLLAKSGFDSYIFCRPGQYDCELPADDFIWVGFDGSKVHAHRESRSYGTLLGEAGKKVQSWLDEEGKEDGRETGCVLWGVGNHGGGPSRADLKEIKRIMEEQQEWHILHSTPEAYFEDREKGMPLVDKDLNPWAVGCYTSQIRIKQKHRQLEGGLALAEKMLSHAALQGLLEFPEKELSQAEKALLFCEFHDILPGTSIAPVEEMSLSTLDQGLAIVRRLKQRAFFALLAGEKKAEEGEYPILLYNPHPHAVEGDFTCEFQLANQNWTDLYAMPEVFQDGKPVPFQVEKEDCNMNLDWRKKVTFHAVLKPACMNRFSVKIRMLDCAEKEKALMRKCGVRQDTAGEALIFETEELYVEISKQTGLLNVYRVDGQDYLAAGAGSLVVMKTDCDPWGMNRHSYREERGRFSLLPREEGSRYSGVSNERHAGEGILLDSLRIVEHGEVRTIVEAVFGYGNSRACIRYLIPAKGKALEMQVHVDWMEKGSLLKLELPTCLKDSTPYTETAYGVNAQMSDGDEKVMQRWCGLWEEKEDRALTVINTGNYGADFKDGVIRISLLHSAVYSAHPIGDRTLLVQDRMLPYMDQGEREFRFVIQGGAKEERRNNIWQEATVLQEAPMAVNAFPAGIGNKVEELITLDNPAVVLSAFRKAGENGTWIFRLFESTGKAQESSLCLPAFGIQEKIEFAPFELKTFRIQKAEGTEKKFCLTESDISYDI